MKRLVWSGALALVLSLGSSVVASAAPVVFGTFASSGQGMIVGLPGLELRSADEATGLAVGDPFEFAVLGTYTQLVPGLGSLPAYFKFSALAPVGTSGSDVLYGPGTFGIGLVSGGANSIPFLLGSFTSATATAAGGGLSVVNLAGTTYSLAGYALSGLPGAGSFGLLMSGDAVPVLENNQTIGFSIPVVAAFAADDIPVPAPGAALLLLLGSAASVLRRRA